MCIWPSENCVYSNIFWTINGYIFEHLKIMVNCVQLTVNELWHLAISIKHLLSQCISCDTLIIMFKCIVSRVDYWRFDMTGHGSPRVNTIPICLSGSREPSIACSSRRRFRPWIWIYSCRMWCRWAYWFDHAVRTISSFHVFHWLQIIISIASSSNSFLFSVIWNTLYIYLYITVVCLILVTRLSTALQLSQCTNLMLQLMEHLSSKVRITFLTYIIIPFVLLAVLGFVIKFQIFVIMPCQMCITSVHYLNCSSKEARFQLECGTNNRGY